MHASWRLVSAAVCDLSLLVIALGMTFFTSITRAQQEASSTIRLSLVGMTLQFPGTQLVRAGTQISPGLEERNMMALLAKTRMPAPLKK